MEKMLASCSLAHKYTSQELMEYISKIESNSYTPLLFMLYMLVCSLLALILLT